MVRKLLILFMLAMTLACCDNGEEGLRESVTCVEIKNESDYDMFVTEYDRGCEKSYEIRHGSKYSFETCDRGVVEAVPYFFFVDSVKIVFSDTFIAVGSRGNRVFKIFDLENGDVFDKSKYYHIVTYTFTNADYEYAKEMMGGME
ncbi:MAG: hypothetical protein MJZ28_01400 [Paludibacteraceae bacterium]|nr:hypothetical protein [Paludibacteraceae bacterium]MCQ2217158.1 hypothetical protein [Paludibacteraceae bacterium]